MIKEQHISKTILKQGFLNLCTAELTNAKCKIFEILIKLVMSNNCDENEDGLDRAHLIFSKKTGIIEQMWKDLVL